MLSFISCGVKYNVVDLDNYSNLNSKDALFIVKKFRSKKNKVYSSLSCLDDVEKKRCIQFIPDVNKVYFREYHKIGEKSINFPTEYFEYNDKLFIIYDTINAVNKKTINRLKKYDVFVLFDEKDILSDEYIYILDEKLKAKKFIFDR